jgi:P pilus assembly chaperone PapD
MKKMLFLLLLLVSSSALANVGVTPMKQYFDGKKFVKVTVYHRADSLLPPVTLTGKIVSNGQRIDGFKVFPPVIKSLEVGEKQIIMVQKPKGLNLDGEQRYYLEIKGESSQFQGGFRVLLRDSRTQ